MYLHAFVDYYQDNWADWFPFAEFAYNNQVHSAIRMSPFYAEYAYNLTFLVDPVNLRQTNSWTRSARFRRSYRVCWSWQQRGCGSFMISRWMRCQIMWRGIMSIWKEQTCIQTGQTRNSISNVLVPSRFYKRSLGQPTGWPSHLPDGWAIHNMFHVSCLIPAWEDTILGWWQEPLPCEARD